MTTAIIFDCETHDTEEPEIIEAAYAEIEFGRPIYLPQVAILCERFKSSKPIKLGAMATHHVMEEDLVDCPDSAEFILPACNYLIAHNVDFDADAGKARETTKRICTLALSRHLWPDLDSHSLGALIYHLDRQNARERLKKAHGAAADVLLCKTVLDAIIAETGVASWESLYQRSEIARVPTHWTFGKHKGMLISESPKDYRAWMLRQEPDQYLRIAIERTMGERKQPADPELFD